MADGVSGATQIESLNVKEFGLLNKCAGQTASAEQAVVTQTSTTPGTGADASTWTGAQCTAAYNDIVAILKLLHQIRTTLVDNGMMKGAA